MKILITNDDGYKAKGIRVLADIMKKFGEVIVIAPSEVQSGMSIAVSLGGKQLVYTDLGDGWGHLNGTPATCVKFAIDKTGLGIRPDIVISGINHGSNAATAACYSGTLGAAAEAAVNGIPSIGVSMDTFNPDADFSIIEKVFPDIFSRLMEAKPSERRVYYNVNFPDSSTIKGVRAAHMGIGYWDLEFVPDETGKGYKLKGEFVEEKSANDDISDHRLVEKGYVSIVPHLLDNTDYDEMRRLSTLF